MKIEIEIDGVRYPCYTTNGAALRFKNETGYDITNTDGGMADNIIYLYCCLVSACKREGKEFPYDLESFADGTPLEVVIQWMKDVEAQVKEQGKKLSKSKKK